MVICAADDIACVIVPRTSLTRDITDYVKRAEVDLLQTTPGVPEFLDSESALFSAREG